MKTTLENKFRFTTMPIPSVDYADGKPYQYIGTTTTTEPIYTNGYFYKCVAQGTDPETYAWEAQPVQEGGGGHTIEDSTGADMTARANLQFVGATVTDDSTNNRTVVTVADASGKADKVSSATNGNLAGLNASGNLTDSGVASANVITKSQTAGLLKNDGTVDTTTYVSDVSGKADKVANATSGNLASLDSNGNIADSSVGTDIFPSTATSSNKLATMADVSGGGGQQIQYDTMPTASSEFANKIIQFTGTTTNDYVNGCFYKCIPQGTSPETYIWLYHSTDEFASLVDVNSVKSIIDDIEDGFYIDMASKDDINSIKNIIDSITRYKIVEDFNM